MNLILGSGSPRRKEILNDLGYHVRCITADVTESTDQSLGLSGLSSFNARLKAEAVYKQLNDPQAVVIGSDTVVWLDGVAYGKPQDHAQACRFLTELSGKTHQVGTAVAFTSAHGTTSFCEIADVTFKPLTTQDILSYIEDIPVMDKAGSYAIQDGGDRIIDHYEGEFETIMGLPKARTKEELEKIDILPNPS